jgi:hypothetical protein
LPMPINAPQPCLKVPSDASRVMLSPSDAAPSGPELYARYFDPEVHAGFRARKRERDPHDLFNRGWVFV